MKNALQYFGRMLNVNNGKFDNFKGINSRGDGWSFGITFWEVSNSQLGNITAVGTRGVFGQAHVSRMQGNPFVGTLVNSKINSITALDSESGIKIQDASKDVTIGSAYFEASEKYHADSNCGFKIQGDTDYIYTPENIYVDKVVVKNCGYYGNCKSYGTCEYNLEAGSSVPGSGLYINGVKNVTLNSYQGVNNGGNFLLNSEKAGWPDVWVDYAKGVKINSILSENCHGSCIAIRNDAADYGVGKVKIVHETDPDAQGIVIIGGPGRIESVEENDKRTYANDRRLIVVNADYTKGSIGSVSTNFKSIPDSGPAGTKLWINKDNKYFKIERFQEINK